MKKRFIDDVGHSITLFVGDVATKIDRSTFIQRFPSYHLPDGFSVRYWEEGKCHWLSDESSQKVAKDLTDAEIQSFFVIIEEQAVLEEAEGIDDRPNWGGLESMLRGSSAWSKMFDAMSKSIRANAAGSLLLISITSTRKVEDLKAGWHSLIGAMDAQSGTPSFTPEELNEVRTAIAANNFPLSEFFAE